MGSIGVLERVSKGAGHLFFNNPLYDLIFFIDCIFKGLQKSLYPKCPGMALVLLYAQ